MSLPKLDTVGDCFLLGNVVYTVTSADSHLITCKFVQNGSYISTFFTYVDLSDAYKNGTLTSWVLEERRPQNTHKHEWKLYKGLNVVEKYCDCGEKKNADWKELS